MQALWLLFAAVTGILTIAGLSEFYGQLQQACDGQNCLLFQLSYENAQALQAAGFSLADYARYTLLTRSILLPLVTYGLGALLMWRKPGDRVACLFAFATVALGASNARGINALASLYPGLQLVEQSIQFIQNAALVPLYSLFPDGRWVPPWSKWVAIAIVIGSLTNFLPGFTLPPGLEVALVGGTFLFVLSVQLYRFWKVSTWTQRQQTKWVVFSLFFLSLPALLIPVWLVWIPSILRLGTPPNILLNVYGFCALLFNQIAFFIAIMHYRLFDIEILINRTLVYSLLTACVVGIYAAIVGGLGALFQSQRSLPLSLLATGLIAVLFQPLRERLQRAINRLMYGERDEPYRVLTRLGQRLEAAIEPAAALPLTVETIAHALKLPYVTIKLKQADTLEIVAAYGAVKNETTAFPLVYAGETIGELSAAQRAPNELLTPADQQLLRDLARQISVTAHAVLLSSDLEQARRRIVAAREEARRRLGSDLHDGVGHQLAGLVRQVETAVSLLDQDPTTARQMLTAVTQHLNTAISQVRHLSHQLHPPELELLGLAGALRERALTHPTLTIRLDAPESLSPLPPAVETAAYYIALEALTNVEKHTGGRSCRLRLALVGGVLEMEIADDGPGLTAGRANGLGLLSMQARAAEVGGSCRLEPGTLGGTQVIVCLPVLEV
ncbi:MAG TPA: histidine kinase [Chloroflexota bacterium]|nr:histidine kinase [Chloroflexota bacterium]